MRTTTRTALAAATLIGLATPATSATALTFTGETSEPQTTRERGIVVECAGTWRGEEVHTVVYENDQYTNHIEVIIGDAEDGGVWKSRDTTEDLWSARRVEATLRLDGKRATIAGTARKVGDRIAVHEEHDDAGQHITVDGFHKLLRNDLELTYRRTTVPLECDTAFFYDLQVTKTDTTGD